MSAHNIWQRQFLHPKYWGTWVFICLIYLCAHLPWRAQLALGKGLGRLLYTFAKRRRHITETNIKLCFADYTDTQQAQLVRDIFEANAIGYMETAMAWFKNIRTLEHKVEIRGLEYLAQAKSEHRGVVLAGAHFTMLDLAGAFSSLFFELNILYRPLNNRLLNEAMMQGRDRFSGQALHKKNVKGFIQLLQAGKIFWYPPDQDYGRKHSVFANLFGIHAATITGLTILHKSSNAMICPFSYLRKKDHSGWLIEIHSPLHMTGDSLQDAQSYNHWLESILRAHPEQYLWSHRRFKTRPKLTDPSFY